MIKPGVRTSEFWLTLLALAALTVASLSGVDVPALEAALSVAAYTLSRAAAKKPTPAPVTSALPIPTQPPPPPPPPDAAPDESEK